MQKLMHRLDAVIKKTAYTMGLLAVANTLLLCFVVCYGVFMRFVLNSPQAWSDELASYCLLFMTFFGLAHTLITGSHIRIDILTDRLARRTRYYFEVVAWTLGTVFSVLLILGSLSAIQNFIERDNHSVAGMDIPLAWPATSMLIGSMLFGLVMLSRLIQLCIAGEAAMATSVAKEAHL